MTTINEHNWLDAITPKGPKQVQPHREIEPESTRNAWLDAINQPADAPPVNANEAAAKTWFASLDVEARAALLASTPAVQKLGR